MRDEQVTPREGAGTRCLGYVIVLRQDFLTAVACVFIFLGVLGVNGRKRIVGVALQEGSGIVKQVELAEQHLLVFAHDEHRQLAHLVGLFPFVGGHHRIEFFATGLEVARLLQHELALVGELPGSIFCHYFNVALQLGHEAIGHAIVIDAPFHSVIAGQGQGQQRVMIFNLAGFERVNGCHHLIDGLHLLRLELRVLAKRGVGKRHTDVTLLQELFAMTGQVVVNTVGKSDIDLCLSVGTADTNSFLCRD